MAREALYFEKTLDVEEAIDWNFKITDCYFHCWGQIRFKNPQQFNTFKEHTLLDKIKIRNKLSAQTSDPFQFVLPLDIICLKKLTSSVCSGPSGPYKRTKANFINLVEWGRNERNVCETFSQGFCHSLVLHSKQMQVFKNLFLNQFNFICYSATGRGWEMESMTLTRRRDILSAIGVNDPPRFVCATLFTNPQNVCKICFAIEAHVRDFSHESLLIGEDSFSGTGPPCMSAAFSCLAPNFPPLVRNTNMLIT